jgi:tRNA modification GTPase
VDEARSVTPSSDELDVVRQLTVPCDHVASAETGEGLAECSPSLLKRSLPTAVRSRSTLRVDARATSLRHFARARRSDGVSGQWSRGELPATVAGGSPREAVRSLEDLIGAVDVEDILDEVFRRFCVGK